MAQLLRGSPATPDVGAAPPSAGTPQPDSTLVLVTEQEVVFSTAAALSSPPATIHRRWPHPTLSPRLSAAIRRIVTPLPEPRPYYPRREANYYEAARMAREMEHL
jgi:hypothetical protein